MTCTASVDCKKEATAFDKFGFYYCADHAKRAQENVDEARRNNSLPLVLERWKLMETTDVIEHDW